MAAKPTAQSETDQATPAQVIGENVVQDLRLYVYYRIRDDIEPASALTAIRIMQQALVNQHGVRAEVLRRREDPATWMEIYSDIKRADDFEQCLDAAVVCHRLDQLLVNDSQRHIERFISLTEGS